jgi:hypothetical protein
MIVHLVWPSTPLQMKSFTPTCIGEFDLRVVLFLVCIEVVPIAQVFHSDYAHRLRPWDSDVSPPNDLEAATIRHERRTQPNPPRPPHRWSTSPE